MESTSGDFWQMIVERDCRVIVMLCPLQEDGQVCIHLCNLYPTEAILERHRQRYKLDIVHTVRYKSL